MTTAGKTMIVIGSVALAVTAFMLRGIVPELVRYKRIRAM